VWFAQLVAPESPPHGHDGELGEDDSAADGSGHLLRALDAETHVAVVVADGDKGLEAGALSGASLLLNGHDLEHVVLERGPDEKVDDLKLLKSDTMFLEKVLNYKLAISY
jgi:hypothetical protein